MEKELGKGQIDRWSHHCASNEYSLTRIMPIFLQSTAKTMRKPFWKIMHECIGRQLGKNNANEAVYNVSNVPGGNFTGYSFNIPTQNFVNEFWKKGLKIHDWSLLCSEKESPWVTGCFYRTLPEVSPLLDPLKVFQQQKVRTHLLDPNLKWWQQRQG